MNNCDFLCFSGGVYVEKYGIVIYAIITSLDQLQILYFQSLVERKIRKFDKIYEKDKVKLQKQNCKSQHHKSQHITILIPKNKNSHYLVNIDYNNFPLSIFKQILLQRLLNEQLIGYLPKENQIFANFTSTITLNSQETLDYLRYQQSLQIKKNVYIFQKQSQYPGDCFLVNQQKFLQILQAKKINNVFSTGTIHISQPTT
eukprot:TRINITY_DN28166_c0_g1_i5.p3 TRINITY_DN28166_c0_g1~~TRINITY_DN28166_c0_g1_i5.p3  ORF type:complete len:201 (+),score=-9.44 TRINITY_DN28166_c0_g1_i5:2973-3575(+)